MEAVDKKLRELLSKKFEGAEMDVDPSIWDGINSSMSTGGVGGSGLIGSSSGIAGSIGFWLAASVVAVSVLTYVMWPEADVPEVQQTAQVETLTQQEEVPVEVEEIIEQEDFKDETEVTTNVVVTGSLPPSLPNGNPTVSSETEDPELDEIPMENTVEEQPREHGSADEIPEQPEVHPQEIEDPGSSVGEDPATHDEQVPVAPSTISEDSSDYTPEVKGIVRPLANVFSPNGDGKNDYILPELNEPETVSIQVIQMTTGQVVFRTQELKAWYGRDMSGQDLPPGSYLYIVEMTDSIGNTDQESGIVRLFR